MAKTTEAYCQAIDDFIADKINYEQCSAIMSADRFNFAATRPQGNPANPDNETLATHGWGGRSGFR